MAEKTAILTRYNPEVYEKIGSLHDNVKDVTEELILKLGDIILADNEVLYETYEDGKKVARVVPFEDAIAQGAVATWCGTDMNKWYPFFYGDSKYYDVNAWKDTVFLDEIKDFLRKNGLDNKVMMVLRKNNDEDAENFYHVEENDDAKRMANYKIFKQSEVKPIESFYEKDGKIVDRWARVEFYFKKNAAGKAEFTRINYDMIDDMLAY